MKIETRNGTRRILSSIDILRSLGTLKPCSLNPPRARSYPDIAYMPSRGVLSKAQIQASKQRTKEQLTR